MNHLVDVLPLKPLFMLFIYLYENTIQVTRIASVDQPLWHQMNINDLNTFLDISCNEGNPENCVETRLYNRVILCTKM